MATTYVPLATQTLSSAASSVTFSSIPQTYTDLVLVVAGGTTVTTDVYIEFNGDTGTNYSRTYLGGNGTSASSGRSTSTTAIPSFYIGSSQSTGYAHIMSYANTNVNKTILTRSSSADVFVLTNVGLWRSTAAINSIKILTVGTNLSSGSTFNLYGIASTAALAKATGGNIITTDGSYWYHAFTSSGTFTPASTLSCDIMVIAGGGGGGANNGAGGGAGGLLSYTSQSITASAQTITVGAGGAGGLIAVGVGTSGSNSQFAALTASVGGGAGNSGGATTGLTGGSGGGSGGPTGGSATSGQGSNGGTGGSSQGAGAGGGGGKGAVGGNNSTTVGGTGGVGSADFSSWGLATGTGQLVSSTYYYAGGGGGGGSNGGGSAGGVGGYGGGADGNAAGVAVGKIGLVNTGGGGGGGGGLSGVGNYPGGAGGSGLVIVRYAV
jgi:hypothetical protein